MRDRLPQAARRAERSDGNPASPAWNVSRVSIGLERRPTLNEKRGKNASRYFAPPSRSELRLPSRHLQPDHSRNDQPHARNTRSGGGVSEENDSANHSACRADSSPHGV